MAQLENLEFKVDGQVTDTSIDSLDRLIATLGNLQNLCAAINFNPIAQNINNLAQSIASLDTVKISSVASSLQSFAAMAIPDSVTQSLIAFGNALNAINSAKAAEIASLASALRNLQGIDLTQIANGIQAVADALDRSSLSNVVFLFSYLRTPDVDANVFNRIAAGFQNMAAAMDNITWEQINKIERLAQAMERLRDASTGWDYENVSKAFRSQSASGTTSFNAGGIAGAAQDIGNSISKWFGSKLTGPIKSVTKAFDYLFNSMKRIAVYRALRTMLTQLINGFKEGIDNLYQYSLLMGTDFASSMDSLATSANYLKNSLAAMAAPLINTLAPAIDYVVDKFVSLINVINEFFAAVTGSSTYTVAKKVATAYADAADSAGEAANKINTLGIDELNVISDDDSSSGSGSSTDYSDMFEEVEVSNEMSDFVNSLVEAFENADWETLGTTIADKINEVIDSIDWVGIGSSLGSGLDGIIQTLYYLISGIDWYNLGSHFADLLNSAIGEVDFTKAGQLLAQAITVIPRILLGLITNLDWGQITSALSDIFIGFFTELTSIIKEYDWAEIGSTLYQQIKSAVSNIDFSGMALSFFTFLGTALRSGVQFIYGFVSDVVDDVKTFWDNEYAGKNWLEVFWHVLELNFQTLGNIVDWVYGYIISPFISALLGEENWMEAGEAAPVIWDAFCNGVINVFAGIPTFIKNNIIIPFANALIEAADWTETCLETALVIWDAFCNGISTLFSNPSQFVFEYITTPIMNALIGEENWSDIVESSNTVYELFVKGIAEVFSGIKEWIGENVIESVVDAFCGEGTWDLLTEVGSDIWDGFTKGISEFFKGIVDWIDENVVTPFVNGVKSLLGISSPSTVFQEIGENVVSGFANGIINTFMNVKESITNWVLSVISWFVGEDEDEEAVNSSTFGKFAKNAITGFKTSIVENYESVLTSITTWAASVLDWFTNADFGAVNFDSFSEFANNTIEGFKTKISSAYTNTKDSIITWGEKVLEWFTSDSFAAVNISTFKDFATDVITSFKERVSGYYTTVKSSITTWGSKIKSWFTSNDFAAVNTTTFKGYATDVITSFKERISGYYTTVKSSMTTWANNVKSWFADIANSNTFYSLASDVISGFKNGIGNLYSSTMSAITSWANAVMSTFKAALGIGSPSKMFARFGGFTVEGFNEGLADEASSTQKVISNWYDSFVDSVPALAPTIDTSGLDYSNSDFGNLNGNVDYNANVALGSFETSVEEFMNETLLPIMQQMAEDIKRQADKNEQTVLKVNGKTLASTVEDQQKINGYSFA